MKDIELLLAETPSFRRVIVYEGQHFCFFDKVLKKIEDEFRSRGNQILPLSWNEFESIASGLAIEKNVFVFDLRGEEYGPELFQELKDTGFIEDLIRIECRAVMILDTNLSCWKKVEESEAYKSFRKDSSVIEESGYSRQAFPAFLKSASSLLRVPTSIRNRDIYLSLFEELWRDLESVPDFFLALEFSTNSFLVKSGEFYEFDSESFRNKFLKKREREYFVFHKLLALFLLKPDETARAKLTEFICNSDMYQNSVRAVVDTLYKAVFELASVNAGLKQSEKVQGISEFKMGQISKYATIPVENLLGFIPRLAEYEPELIRQRQTFVFNFNKLLLEFRE